MIWNPRFSLRIVQLHERCLMPVRQGGLTVRRSFKENARSDDICYPDLCLSDLQTEVHLLHNMSF
jgi:hypothetical protein